MLTNNEIFDLMMHYLGLISKAKQQGNKSQQIIYEYQLRLLEMAYERKITN